MENICDSCQYALEDETLGYDFDAATIEMIALEFGSEVSDHLCDARESGGDIPCTCACNSH